MEVGGMVALLNYRVSSISVLLTKLTILVRRRMVKHVCRSHVCGLLCLLTLSV